MRALIIEDMKGKPRAVTMSNISAALRSAESSQEEPAHTSVEEVMRALVAGDSTARLYGMTGSQILWLRADYVRRTKEPAYTIPEKSA